MKKILSLVLATLAVGVLTAQPVPVAIPAAKTIAALPLWELNGKTLDGVTIQTVFFDDHSLAMAEFVSGKTPMILTGSALGIRNARSGGPTELLVTPVWDINTLVATDPALKTLADFAGKNILVPVPGGPVDLQFKAILKAQGLTDKIKVDYAEPVQAAALLAQKKAAGAILPEPFASRLVLDRRAQAVTSLAQLWSLLNGGDGRSPAVSLFVRKDFAAAHQAFLKDLAAELQKSTEWIRANPEAASQKFAPVLGLSPEVVRRGIEHTRFEVPSAKEQKHIFEQYSYIIEGNRNFPESFFIFY